MSVLYHNLSDLNEEIWRFAAGFLLYNGRMTWWQAQNDTQILTAAALIYDDTPERVKVFLVRRAANRQFLPGVPELPGGRIRFGERIETGLGRQIREKLHVEITLERPFFVFDYLNSDRREHVAEIVYLARLHAFKPQEISLKKEKYAQSFWVGLDEVESLLGEMKLYSPQEYDAVVQALVGLERQRQLRSER